MSDWSNGNYWIEQWSGRNKLHIDAMGEHE
jgi:hypothetical protein